MPNKVKANNLPVITCRSGPHPAVPGDPQFSLQAGSAPRPALHLPGQAWLGSVLLQGRPKGAQRPHSQEPASVHRHEPHRPQRGAFDPSGEQARGHSLYVCVCVSE